LREFFLEERQHAAEVLRDERERGDEVGVR